MIQTNSPSPRLVIHLLLVLNIAARYGSVQAALHECYPGLGCFDGSILHALPQEPTHVRTEFQLSCQGQVDNATIRAVDNQTEWRETLDTDSCFQVQRDTAFVIHGFRDRGTSKWVTDIRDFLVAKRDYNVFVMDWHHGAGFLYEQAAANTFLVARQLSLFIETLGRVFGLDPQRIHLIGHSLGAHIAGNTGGFLKSFKLARITGLDPAEPYFDQVADDRRLDKGDASFVDVIHTDGERFTGFKGFGSRRSQGHVDFYPNGGQKQPGCEYIFVAIGPDPRPESTGRANSVTGCSHSRAHQLFVQSLTSTACHFEAVACASWEEFNKGTCTTCPPSGCARMGLDTPVTARGDMYFTTTFREPYCGATFLVNLTTSSDQGHSYGHFEMGLLNQSQNNAFLMGEDTHFHQSQTFQYVATFPSDVTSVDWIQLGFVKGTGFSSLWTSSSLHLDRISVTSFDGQHRFGAPRGLVLDSAFYTLYTLPLGYVTKDPDMELYADDTQLFKASRTCNISSTFQDIQKCCPAYK